MNRRIGFERKQFRRSNFVKKIDCKLRFFVVLYSYVDAS